MFGLALDGLGGIPEFELTAAGWTQAAVDARWVQIGQSGPAPIVPLWLIGKRGVGTKAGTLWYAVGSSRKTAQFLPKDKTQAKAVRDFLNFFGKVAQDPYRKSSGISKVAGGLLQVASVAIPAFGYFQAVATAGNMALSQGKPKADAALAARVMAPALAQSQAADKAAFTAQIEKLKSLAPPVKAASMAQENFAAARFAHSAPQKSATNYSWWVLGAFAVGAVMVVRR